MLEGGKSVRCSDGTVIGLAEGSQNPDYLAYRDWLDGGGVPEPADIDPDWFMAHVTDCAQKRLDAFAQTRGYDGIVSLCSYATSANPTFGAEGQRGVALRDATWQALIDLKQAVINGERSMPGSWEAVEAELPALTWSDE